MKHRGLVVVAVIGLSVAAMMSIGGITDTHLIGDGSSPTCARREAGTTVSSISINPDRSYAVHHLSANSSGTSSTSDIFLGMNVDPDTDYADSTGEVVLQPGTTITVGPGVETLYFQTSSGTASFQIIPGARRFGAW